MGKTETPNRKENPLLFWFSIWVFLGFYFRKLKMAYLLIFVILLHLITLAMLFIATMEKVLIGVWHVMSVHISVSAVHCIMSHFSFQSWWEWGGLENSDLWYNCRFDNFTGIWLCASSKENGKENKNIKYSFAPGDTWNQGRIYFFQSGFSRCRCWWSSLWSSPRSPFWCSWASCSPCPREDFSTSPDCVKSLQVSAECNNVLLTTVQRGHLKISCSCQSELLSNN